MRRQETTYGKRDACPTWRTWQPIAGVIDVALAQALRYSSSSSRSRSVSGSSPVQVWKSIAVFAQ